MQLMAIGREEPLLGSTKKTARRAEKADKNKPQGSHPPRRPLLSPGDAPTQDVLDSREPGVEDRRFKLRLELPAPLLPCGCSAPPFRSKQAQQREKL